MLRRPLFYLALFMAGPVFALYDPKPEPSPFTVQGEWQGTLTYRDYSDSKRMVTLPTRLFVALSAPSEIVLHYTYVDGPKKMVYSYERITFDSAKHQLVWTTGKAGADAIYTVTSDTSVAEVRTLLFERQAEGVIRRYTLEISARKFRLGEDEVGPTGTITFRNRYELHRPAT